MLKAQTAQSQVVLRVIQTLSEDAEEDSEAASMDELDHLDEPREDTLNWTPLWTRWLGLPRWGILIISVDSALPLQFYSVNVALTQSSSFQPHALVPGHRPAKDQQRELGIQYRRGL